MNQKYDFGTPLTEDITLYSKFVVPYTPENDSTYPFTVSDDGKTITSTNKVSSSSASYSMTFAVSGTLTFNCSTSTESGSDYLYIYKNGSKLYNYSGTNNSISLSISVSAGDTIKFTYSKDGSINSGTDTVTVSDIMFTEA